MTELWPAYQLERHTGQGSGGAGSGKFFPAS